MDMLAVFIGELQKIANGDEPKGGTTPTEEGVLKFIKHHPRPTDKDFHGWAERKGHKTDEAERVAYGIISDLLHKGKSKGKMPSGIPEERTREGVKVEHEHTPNPIIAKKITEDHHAETGKDYYPSLKGLEKVLAKGRKD